jgi:S1-C subfamily serine protease
VIGTRHTHIVAASGLDGLLECTYDGQPVLGLFLQLSTFLSEVCGPAGASLLALPERAFSKTRQSEMITWYTDRPGTFRPVATLPAEQREAAEAGLRILLAKAAPVADGRMHDMLSVALNLAGPDNMLFDGETVVLVNWGLRSAQTPPAALPYLSPYLPAGLAILPILETSPALAASAAHAHMEHSAGSGDERAADQAAVIEEEAVPPVARAAPNGGSAPDDHSGQRGQTVFPMAVVAAPVQTGYLAATWWLMGVALALAIFTVYLLWPGNLLYPTRSTLGSQALAPTLESLGIQADESLRNQISELQSGLGGNVCIAPNRDRLDGISNLPLLMEPSSRPVGQGGASNIPQPGQSLPLQSGWPAGSPAATPAVAATTADQTTALPAANLLANLEAGTVIVVGSTAQRETSIGSGFFVSARHILTNGHVVADVQAGTVFVANKAMGRPLPARVLAVTTSGQDSGDDFALLELERDASQFKLPFASVIDRLDSVVASGYPSFVVDRDPNFYQAFSQGEWSHLGDIQLTVSRGEITAKQRVDTGPTVLAHSATISPGSSGGPLVDRCGRIVGVNTYIRTDQESFARLNYAQSATDAMRFLAANGISVPVVGTACADAVAAPGSSPLPSTPLGAQP